MTLPSIRFKALGKSFTFYLGFAAWVEVEETLGDPFMVVLARFYPELLLPEGADPLTIAAARSVFRFADLRAVFVAGLREHHPEADEALASKIIEKIGIEEAKRILDHAATASANVIASGEGDKPNPPKGRRKS